MVMKLDIEPINDAPLECAIQLRPLPGVRAVVPTLHRFTNLHAGDKKTKVLVTGIDVNEPESVAGFKLAQGELPAAAGQLALEAEMAASLKLHVGDEVQLRTYVGLQTQKVVGLFNVEDVARLQQGGMLVVPIQTLQRSFRSSGLVTGLELFLLPDQSVDQVIADPQIKDRGLLVEHEHPVLGKTRLPGVPIRFAEGALALERAPSLGEHNREIARDLGYADPDIAGLERDGVLHSAPARATER
jgi:ABC-type lipoprotein release transport system permease subunit